MEAEVLYWIFGIGAFVGSIFWLCGMRIIQQYEKGVRLRLGRYKDTLDEGFHWVIPGIDSLEKVDIRQMTIDLQPQDVMTKDQVNLKIDGVVFYTVENPKEAVLNVSDLRRQLEDKATSELKEIIGKKTMAESLSMRDEIASELIKKIKQCS